MTITSSNVLELSLPSLTGKQLDAARCMIGDLKLRIRLRYADALHKYLLAGQCTTAAECFDALRPLNSALNAINTEEEDRRRGIFRRQ